ncbi:hypothetical protein GF377_05135, partial [candidate division GN15 bacterium]|nr:hypothetical protein [candidate division GN15 bacterium]
MKATDNRRSHMQSRIADAIKLASAPVAVLLTDRKPDKAIQFKKEKWGCVGAMLVTASRRKGAVFDRETFGCVGGGVGLGFGNTYEGFPIEHLLSEGNLDDNNTDDPRPHVPGEHYLKTPELACEFVDSLPMRDVATQFVVFKPLEQLNDNETPETVVFLVNPDQLSALVVLAHYNRGGSQSVISPWAAGCQSVLFGYAEAERDQPRAVIGFFDITVRRLVPPDILTLTV